MGQRKEGSSRQAGRQRSRTEGGWCPPAPTALAGWAQQVGQSGTAPREQPQAHSSAAVLPGLLPWHCAPGGATALQQLELMSLHYNCAHGFTTIRVPGHVSASQLCTDSPSLMSQWCLRSPGSPEAMSLVTSPCHSHARSLLMTSVPGDARPTAVPTVSSFPVSLVPSSCHSCAHSFAITSVPGHVAELPPHSNWHTQ